MISITLQTKNSMCFLLRGRKKIKTAREDIIVFKMISKSGCSFYYNLVIKKKVEKWTPGYIYMETTPFKSMERVSFVDGRDGICVEGDAFHSRATLEGAMNMVYSLHTQKVVVMVIPKGSLYLKNETEYVSSSLYYVKQTKKIREAIEEGDEEKVKELVKGGK